METMILANRNYSQDTVITSGSKVPMHTYNPICSKWQQILIREMYDSFIQKKNYSQQGFFTFGSIIMHIQEDLELDLMKLQEHSLHNIWDGEENEHWDEFLSNA